MQLFVLIATTDVPHIIQVYEKETAYSEIKSVVRSWARSTQLVQEHESVRKMREPAEPGVWLEQTSFGWLLKRVHAPVAGWIYNSASTSTILAEIRLCQVERSSVADSFEEQRESLLNAELQLQATYTELQQQQIAYREQKLECEKLRNEIERDDQEQMLSLLLELEKYKQGSKLELEQLNKLNITLADVIYTAQVLMWTLKQTEAKLEAANQALVINKAIYEVEVQQERCIAADLKQSLDQSSSELKHLLEVVHPELCYKHEIEMVTVQNALSNLSAEYALAKENFQARLAEVESQLKGQLEESVERCKQMERVQHELASHNLEQAFEICLLQSSQSNLRAQLDQKKQLLSATAEKHALAQDQVSYERQLKEQEQQLNGKLDEMCQELCKEVDRLRTALQNSEAESTDAWVCRKLMAENERLQTYGQELAAVHQKECDDFRAFITEQSQEYSDHITQLERRLQSQAQTIKNFQEEKAVLLNNQRQLLEERDQLKWSNTLYADQAEQKQPDDRDHELAVLRSKLEAAEQREREMEENLEQTLQMSEERRAMLNSREKESDIYFEQWQTCCQTLEEKAQELDRAVAAQQESADKVMQQQKRISELESMVRKMEADLAYVVDLHWGRSL